MSSNSINVFMTGVTGYIGGAVFEKFLDLPNLSIRVLVRSAEKAEKLKTFGVTPVVGSLKDLELLERLASETDIFIALADSDDLPGAQATLRGLKKRFEQTGKKPIFINTSGGGELTLDTKGLRGGDTVYDDMDTEQIQAISPTAVHRHVDSFIDREGEKGYVDTYIVMPTIIWGVASGRLANAGIVNTFSIPFPVFMKLGATRGHAPMFGKGLNIWPHVEIHELADFYVLLFNAILEGSAKHPALASGRAGYYFVSCGDVVFHDAAKVIGQALVELGLSQSPEPTPFTKEEIDRLFGGEEYFGGSVRCIPNRTKALGWRPVKTTADLLESTAEETKIVLDTGYDALHKLMQGLRDNGRV